MADTDKIFGKPGIAMFAEDAHYGASDPRYGDFPAQTISVAAAGAIDLPIYSVVTVDPDAGSIALRANADTLTGNQFMAVTTAPVYLEAGQSTTLDVYNSGHFDTEMLNFDNTVDTAEKRVAMFRDPRTPDTLMGSAKKHKSENIAV